MRLLVVDDDVVDRELISRLLSRSSLTDYTIDNADSVTRALSLLETHEYNLLLVDYRMPERDGIELILAMRRGALGVHTAIVMMSSSEDEQLAVECIKAGAQDFLVKSEITESRLRRAMLHAEVRYGLETELYESYRKVKELAEKDALTGLSNRYLFDETLKVAVANNRRNKFKLALMLVDLDGFKSINDTYGHDVGDKVLVAFVQRLKSELRNEEMFARLGGDEFALLLTNLPDAQHASLVAKRLANAGNKPIYIDSLEFFLSASFGVAIHPDNGTTDTQLIKFADIAMYRAKKSGKGRICFFENDMQSEFLSTYVLEQEMVHALANDQFELYFQPIYDAKNMRIDSFEALIRWNHPQGIKYPDQFIPVAEESNIINEIGYWVVQQSIKVISAWNRQHSRHYKIAINLSPRQLSAENFVERIESVRKELDCPAELIELELTETLFLSDVEIAIQCLERLHGLGYRIALDDFGTGFSSISHLQKFPIDTVKIDKSLMVSQESSSKEIALFKGLISMLDYIGHDIVVEGVEVESNLDLCQSLNVDRVQGYFLSKPQPQRQLEIQLFA